MQEFPLLTRRYLEQAFAQGRLRVEGPTMPVDAPLRAGRRMRHLIHRHEPPVPDTPIQVSSCHIYMHLLGEPSNGDHVEQGRMCATCDACSMSLLAQVLGMTRDLVAVAKPGGVPVHVAGQHRKNTVAGILGALQPGLGPLLPVHRLDKPVSGVLLFARTSAAAEAFRVQMQV